MLRCHAVRSVVIGLALFSAVSLFVAVRPAQADSVQISLNNLAFDSSSGSELFNGSFLYDPALNSITSVNISATGATDSFPPAPLDFFGVDLTGFEPFQFAFDDGLSDFLFLSLPSGLSASSYGFADATLLPAGVLAPLGFSLETASSGSFSVVATPEPNPLTLLFTGLLIFGLSRIARGG